MSWTAGGFNRFAFLPHLPARPNYEKTARPRCSQRTQDCDGSIGGLGLGDRCCSDALSSITGHFDVLGLAWSHCTGTVCLIPKNSVRKFLASMNGPGGFYIDLPGPNCFSSSGHWIQLNTQLWKMSEKERVSTTLRSLKNQNVHRGPQENFSSVEEQTVSFVFALLQRAIV